MRATAAISLNGNITNQSVSYVGIEVLGQLKKEDINIIFGFSETIVVMMMFLVIMLLQVLVQVGGKRRQ